MNPQSNILPRPDLRERAFRRFEHYIARACTESYTVDPKAELNLNARTFAARFRDAVLGYVRYNYKSHIIPESVDTRSFKAYELDTGFVLIKNSVADAQATVAETLYTASNPQSIIDLMAKVGRERSPLPFVLPVKDKAELDAILAIAKANYIDSCHVREFDGKVHFLAV